MSCTITVSYNVEDVEKEYLGGVSKRGCLVTGEKPSGDKLNHYSILGLEGR